MAVYPTRPRSLSSLAPIASARGSIDSTDPTFHAIAPPARKRGAGGVHARPSRPGGGRGPRPPPRDERAGPQRGEGRQAHERQRHVQRREDRDDEEDVAEPWARPDE